MWHNNGRPTIDCRELNPVRWTALTWLAVLLWSWQPIVLNYPPSASYSKDFDTGEFTVPTYYQELSDIPFAVGWPLHYIRPYDPAVTVSPVLPVGTPPPMPVPAAISPLAMVANFLLITLTILALIYVSQRTMPRFSMLGLLVLMSAFPLYYFVVRSVVSFAGHFAGEVVTTAVYFSPVVAATVVRYRIYPRQGWATLFRKSSPQCSVDDYENADDALAVASQLDRNGDWNASINLYRLSADRWPEHSDYIQNCIDRIAQKKSLSAR